MPLNFLRIGPVVSERSEGAGKSPPVGRVIEISQWGAVSNES